MVDWGRDIVASLPEIPEIPEIPEERPCFPVLLWQLLLQPAGCNLAYWMSPTHFVLVKSPALERYLLRFFASGRLASFMRQLNYWGFSCSNDRWSHPHFQLSNRVQAMAIKRKSNKWKLPKKEDAWEESKRRVEMWNDPSIVASVEFAFIQETALERPGVLDV